MLLYEISTVEFLGFVIQFTWIRYLLMHRRIASFAAIRRDTLLLTCAALANRNVLLSQYDLLGFQQPPIEDPARYYLDHGTAATICFGDLFAPIFRNGPQIT